MQNSFTKSVKVYNFIYDESQVERFAKLIDTENTLQQVYLQARRKYNKELKKDCFITTNTFFKASPSYFLNRIKRYEVEVGSYKDHDKEIPEDCFAIYSSTNPCSGKKSVGKFVEECVQSFIQDKKRIFEHPHRELDSFIMSTNERVNILTMDIDCKEDYKEVKEFLITENIPTLAVIETRGGYHVLVKPDNNISKLQKKFGGKIQIKNLYCPIPGTLQGGFPVRFVE
jgi:hypothetical protein